MAVHGREARPAESNCHFLQPHDSRCLVPKHEKSELERLKPQRLISWSLPRLRDEGGDQRWEEPSKAEAEEEPKQSWQQLAVIASQEPAHRPFGGSAYLEPINRQHGESASPVPEQRCSAASEQDSTTQHVGCEERDEVPACWSTPKEPSASLQSKLAWKAVIAVETMHQISIRGTAEREHERERLAVQLVVRRTCRCQTGSATIGLSARWRKRQHATSKSKTEL